MKSCLRLTLAGLAVATASGPVAAAPPDPERDPLSFDFRATQAASDLPGPPNYNVTVRLAATLTQSLPRNWLVRASVSNQYNSGPGLSLEQTFAPTAFTSLNLLRGRDYGRDSGFISNVELYSPNLCSSLLRKCRAVLFYDRNYVRYNRNLGGQLRSGGVGSVGVGLRMQLDKGMNLQLDYGHVVRADQMPDDARNRMTLRLGYSF